MERKGKGKGIPCCRTWLWVFWRQGSCRRSCRTPLERKRKRKSPRGVLERTPPSGNWNEEEEEEEDRTETPEIASFWFFNSERNLWTELPKWPCMFLQWTAALTGLRGESKLALYKGISVIFNILLLFSFWNFGSICSKYLQLLCYFKSYHNG